MIDRKSRFEAFVHQVGVEHGHLFGQHHALVDDRPAGQRRQIEAGNPRCCSCFFDPATDHIQLALERFFIDAFRVRDQNLFDLGPGRVGLVAKAGHIDRHMAPAIDIVAHAQNFGFHDGPALLLRTEIGARQKDLTNGNQLIQVGFMAGATDLVVEEWNRDLHVDTRAIAGLTIGVHGTAVPDCLKRVDPGIHHLA